MSAVPALRRGSLDQVQVAMDRAADALVDRQQPDGSWHGDYCGPAFLLPTYGAMRLITSHGLAASEREDIRRRLEAMQNEDGGWGLYAGGPSQLYPGVACYAVARMLGSGADAGWIVQARTWIRSQGGAVRSAPWGKFLLAMLGLHPYSGLIPYGAELWLLPSRLPLHPANFWCHSRQVYLPMSYISDCRIQRPTDALTRKIRSEIYLRPYDQISWADHRYDVAPTDSFVPLHRGARSVFGLVGAIQTVLPDRLRNIALDRVRALIALEDEQTNYINLGPVNKILNMIVAWHEDPGGRRFRRHLETIDEYLRHTDSGLDVGGYNSSRLWDTGFSVQALAKCDGRPKLRSAIQSGVDFIARNQIHEDPADGRQNYRFRTKGAWPFSDRRQGWPTADCTAEAVSALADSGIEPASQVDWDAATRILLDWQNPDGGWPTYEPARAGGWLEFMNPACVFDGIVVDYSYPECTASVVAALQKLRPRAAPELQPRIVSALRGARRYLLKTQRVDGSWYGSWGICFTYGTWFGVHGLRTVGVGPAHPAMRYAADFLLSTQLADGGWGETMDSCRQGRYCSSQSGLPVQTAWSILALLDAGYGAHVQINRAVQFLLDRQDAHGTWTQDEYAGVFNRTCAIHYDNYASIFPLWALARVIQIRGKG